VPSIVSHLNLTFSRLPIQPSWRGYVVAAEKQEKKDE
jgi:hypothetical protein